MKCILDILKPKKVVQSIEIKVKNQIKVDTEIKFYVVKDHASLDNLDYENSGHTGFASTKFVNEELEKKVDKVVGKNLSSEDYTKEEKEKLGNISNITEQEIIAILGG